MADPQQVIQTQTTIPDYAKAYVEQMLGAGAGAIYDYDSSGKIIGLKPFKPYEGERTAQLSDLQLQALQGAGNLGVSPQIGAATNLATNAGLMALERSQYQPTQFNDYLVEGPQQVSAMGDYSTPVFEGAQTEYTPDMYAYQMGPVEGIGNIESQAYQMAGAQTDYTPEMYAYQMGPAEQVGYGSITDEGRMEQYMSPYMQSVVDIQQREAQRQADIATTGRHSQQVQQGAFGGSRGAIMDAEAARNLAIQKGDIQAQGLQAAYGQGMTQFNTEQQRQQAAEQANQQANLTVGQQNLQSQLGVQQTGAQMGLQANLANLSNVQQAQVANQAAQMQAQGMNAQQAMQAALANQQAGLSIGQQNLASQLGVQSQGAQMAMQANLANLSNVQQAQVANQAAQLQMQGLSAQQSMQAALANQQANMQAASQNQQAQLQTQQLREQSNQYGAGLGLQGLNTALQSAGALGQLGQTQFGQQTGAIGIQNQLGTQVQQNTQNVMNQDYQDWLSQQQRPLQQVGFMSDLLRGVPLSQSTQTVFGQQPSGLSQVAGLGTAIAGASKLFSKGGVVTRYASGGFVRPAGLAELIIHKIR